MTDDEISEILLPLMPLKDPYVFARAIAAAEREACAKVCENLTTYPETRGMETTMCAAEIRMRSND